MKQIARECHRSRSVDLNDRADGAIAALHVLDSDFEQVLSVQHGIDGRREQSQVPEPGSAAMVKKTAYPH